MCFFICRFVRSSVRNHFFLICGLVIGVCLSAFTSQFLQNNCLLPTHLFWPSTERVAHIPKTDDYEPRINLVGKPVKAQKTPQDFTRPRYYTTELGIREKLFVAVITSPGSVNKYALAFNKTVGHTVDKIMFFMEAESSKQKTMSMLQGVVQFTDSRLILKPFHTLKYIQDNFIDEYDYFLIVRDTTYVNGRKLRSLAQQISVSENVHAGTVTSLELPNFCSLDSGILMSSSVLQRTTQNLDWCVKNAYSTSDDANLGRCILHSTNINCQKKVQGIEINSFELSATASQLEFSQLSKSDEFDKAFSLWPIRSEQDFYKLHMYFVKNDLKKINYEITSLRHSILTKKVVLDNNTVHLPSWPIGAQPFNKPQNRFDVIRWDYFTDTQIFLKSDFTNVEDLRGADLLDIKYVIQASKSQMESKYYGQIQFKKLINGYRKFDPSRGMDYILDLAFKDITSEEEVIKRIEVCKPLGKVEIIPVQYVTENTRVNIILFVNEENKYETLKFMQNYATVCMEKHDKTFLMLVLSYKANQPGKGSKQDIYAELKDLAVKYSERFKKDNNKIAWLSVKLPDEKESGGVINDGLLSIMLMDLVVKKFSPDNLILLTTSNMEIKQEYLNRVRMNTIKERQIFSAIPFSEFNPLIVYNEDLPRPKELDINKNYGHYDDFNTDHISFYVRDYTSGRKGLEHTLPVVLSDKDLSKISLELLKQLQMSQHWNFPDQEQDRFIHSIKRLSQNSLYSLFIQYNQLNILRAVEPSLRLKYKEKNCYKYNPSYNQLDSDLFGSCIKNRHFNQGTRSHLARIILDYVGNA